MISIFQKENLQFSQYFFFNSCIHEKICKFRGNVFVFYIKITSKQLIHFAFDSCFWSRNSELNSCSCVHLCFYKFMIIIYLCFMMICMFWWWINSVFVFYSLLVSCFSASLLQIRKSVIAAIFQKLMVFIIIFITLKGFCRILI